jgi:Tetraacyldisaccharide-1-P 4''-kinase
MKTPSFWYKSPGWLSFLLSPLGWLYGRVGTWLMTLSQPAPLSSPVISVGNITCGGAGKTPVSIALALLLKAEGHQVHFVTRGYGGKFKGPVAVNPRFHTVKDVGDESLLLAHYAPTRVDKKRKDLGLSRPFNKERRSSFWMTVIKREAFTNLYLLWLLIVCKALEMATLSLQDLYVNPWKRV